jgi:hypothetical protein
MPVVASASMTTVRPPAGSLFTAMREKLFH